jgi:hypothetical protein
MTRLFWFFFLLAAPWQLFAYLDPGSGSALLYALVGLSISVVYFLKGLWLDIRLKLGMSKRGQDLLTFNADFLFHSEGPQYDHLFVPLLKLFPDSYKIAYVTHYEREGTAFAALPEHIKNFSVETDAKGFALLNMARAKVFVTTTPQLDVMMFKRSKHVQHYCHLLHAASDISTYRWFGFDQFDSVLCAGAFMEKSFRTLEELRKTRKKMLFVSGVTYFDHFAQMADKSLAGKAKKTILIAPSWGPNALFSVYGTAFLKHISSDYEIIVRPHPQLKKSEKALYEEVRHYCNDADIRIDENPDNSATLQRADLLITDFSGVAYDFAFGYEKPVITLDVPMDYSLFEGRFLNTAPYPEGVVLEVGRCVSKEEIDNLNNIITQELSRSKTDIIKSRDTFLANYGSASPTIKNQLVSILDQIN